MESLELVLILLAVTAILRLVSTRLSIPQPVLLVVGGLLLAVTPGLPRFQADPGVVFLIFIPPLLYEAALNTSLRDFRRNLPSISLLAFWLVLVSMCAVAWAAHALIPGMSWGSGFVLGAIVSPPDAVAVTAVTRRLKLPITVNTVLEGESLVNDATALVAYRMGVAAVVAGTFSLPAAGLRFILTGAGGVAFGLAMGWLIGRIRRWVSAGPVVENTISLLTPFAVFIPAERLGLASVISVVAAGLYLGRQGPKLVSARTRIQNEAMWQMLVFILEGLIFILIGLELPTVRKSIGTHSFSLILLYTAIISVVLIVVRIAWMFPGAYLPYLVRKRRRKKGDRPPWKAVLFVGWAGMRGGDSLVIALALPLVTATGTPFPGRDLIIFLTFGVILVSLVVQGLSLKPVIRLLKLGVDGTADKEEANARLISARAGMARLDAVIAERNIAQPLADKLRGKYGFRLQRLEKNGLQTDPLANTSNSEAMVDIRQEMIAAERAELIRLRDNNDVSDDVMRNIQEDLDLEEVLLSSEDLYPED